MQQPTALHRRQMLPNHVQLADRRSRLEQSLIDRNLVGERDTFGGHREHRRRAAAERDDQQVVRRECIQHFASGTGRGSGRVVGYRMGRAKYPHFRWRRHCDRCGFGNHRDRIDDLRAEASIDLGRHARRRLADSTRSRSNREAVPRRAIRHPSRVRPGAPDRPRRSPRERFFPDRPAPRSPSPTLLSMNSPAQRLRLWTDIFPEDSATSTISAIPTNRPVPTTPGISRISRSSRAGFEIRFRPQSRIRLPLSVTN